MFQEQAHILTEVKPTKIMQIEPPEAILESKVFVHVFVISGQVWIIALMRTIGFYYFFLQMVNPYGIPLKKSQTH